MLGRGYERMEHLDWWCLGERAAFWNQVWQSRSPNVACGHVECRSNNINVVAGNRGLHLTLHILKWRTELKLWTSWSQMSRRTCNRVRKMTGKTCHYRLLVNRHLEVGNCRRSWKTTFEFPRISELEGCGCVSVGVDGPCSTGLGWTTEQKTGCLGILVQFEKLVQLGRACRSVFWRAKSAFCWARGISASALRSASSRLSLVRRCSNLHWLGVKDATWLELSKLEWQRGLLAARPLRDTETGPFLAETFPDSESSVVCGSLRTYSPLSEFLNALPTLGGAAARAAI